MFDTSYVTAMVLAQFVSGQKAEYERIASVVTQIKATDEAMIRVQYGHKEGVHHHIPQYFEHAKEIFSEINNPAFILQYRSTFGEQGGLLFITRSGPESNDYAPLFFSNWKDVVASSYLTPPLD